MSEKKSKEKRQSRLSAKLELPVFDLDAQLVEIKKLCEAFDFDQSRLVSYILAEFLFSMQTAIEQSNVSMAFMAFLQHVEKLGKRLREVQNETGKTCENN